MTVNFGSAVTYVDERIAEYRGSRRVIPWMVNREPPAPARLLIAVRSPRLARMTYWSRGDFLQDVTGVGSSGFTIEMNNDYGDILEDEITSSAGTYSASATQDVSGWWLMSLAAFKVASTGVPRQAPRRGFRLPLPRALRSD